MGAADAGLPSNLDQVYAEGNPEEGQREYHHITLPIQLFMYGETFYVPVGGGAGYGDVLERDPQAVLDDLAVGLVTPWVAANIYKVAYDQRTMRLDEKATEELRAAAIAERKSQAKPFGEFEEYWNKQRPSEDVLGSYVTYPHPNEGIKQGPLMPSL